LAYHPQPPFSALFLVYACATVKTAPFPLDATQFVRPYCPIRFSSFFPSFKHFISPFLFLKIAIFRPPFLPHPSVKFKTKTLHHPKAISTFLSFRKQARNATQRIPRVDYLCIYSPPPLVVFISHERKKGVVEEEKGVVIRKKTRQESIYQIQK